MLCTSVASILAGTNIRFLTFHLLAMLAICTVVYIFASSKPDGLHSSSMMLPAPAQVEPLHTASTTKPGVSLLQHCFLLVVAAKYVMDDGRQDDRKAGWLAGLVGHGAPRS